MSVHHQLRHDRADLLGWQHVVHLDALHRAQRHHRHQRLLRILHDGDAACALDGHQPVRAVGHASRQHDADRAVAVVLCGGAEQRIDRRSKPMLARTARQADMAAVDDEVPVGRRHINVAATNRFGVLGGCRAQRADSIQNGGQERRSFRRRVDDDEDGGGEILGEAFNHGSDGVEPSCGLADDYTFLDMFGTIDAKRIIDPHSAVSDIILSTRRAQ